MASAPMFVEHRIIGVLSLASCQPHAFDRPRLVWLLALILAPFANLLQYTTQRMEMGRFIQVRSLLAVAVAQLHAWLRRRAA